MFVFEFLKKIFGWADEGSRKRRADSFSFETEFITPKKQCCNHKTARIKEEVIGIDDDSDSDDLEIISESKQSLNSCNRVNGIHKCQTKSHVSNKIPQNSATCKSYRSTNHTRLNMGYFRHRIQDMPESTADHKHPTLAKTHRLKEKDQYEELLQNFLPQRISILSTNKQGRQSSVQQVPEVIDLDQPTPSTSTKVQYSPKKSEISKSHWFPKRKIEKEREKIITLNGSGKAESTSVNSDVTEIPKSTESSDKSSDVTVIENVPVNTLRDKLAAKAVMREDFIPQVAKRYNERIEQRYKEAEELKKMTCVLSKHNRLAREAALEEQLARSMRLIEAVLDEREEPEEPHLPTLTDEMMKEIKSALVPRPPDEVLAEGFGLRITRKDLHTLADLNWLNDEVINFYMNLLIARGTEEKYPKVHAMNTFFYPKLISSGHSSLKRWTRKVDIFAQDLIVVPIHLGIHWCMSIIDFRDKTIRYYDSMGSNNPKCLSALRQYLEEESLDKKKKTYNTSDWKLECAKNIPQQMNGSDCGVFSCMFAEYICANRKITFTQQDMPYFRFKMVYEILKGKLL